MRRADEEREPSQSAEMANGRCRMHGGLSPDAPKGNKNVTQKKEYGTSGAISKGRRISGLRAAWLLRLLPGI
jgi:hypothetical protein